MSPDSPSQASDTPKVSSEQARQLLWAFDRIRNAVARFGSAHDARDRGYHEAAEKIDAEGVEDIRDVFARVAGLQDWLPQLAAMLHDATKVADGGFTINPEMDRARQQLRERSENALDEPPTSPG